MNWTVCVLCLLKIFLIIIYFFVWLKYQFGPCTLGFVYVLSHVQRKFKDLLNVLNLNIWK